MSSAAEPRPATGPGTVAERSEAEALDRQIHDFIARSTRTWTAEPEELDQLLRQVFAHQIRWNPAYARYAARRGAENDRIRRVADIPAVPARAFTRMRMATFPPEHTVRRFRSSGTTGGPRAVLELDPAQLALYDAALLPPFVRYLLPDRRDLAWVALLPDPFQAPESSLAAIIGSAALKLNRRVNYCGLAGGGLDVARARTVLAAHKARPMPVLLLATALTLDRLVTELAADHETLALPPGSRVMETGGFKGRRKDVERATLISAITTRLGIPAAAVIGEYGMTEMTSQFYDPSFREAVLTGTSPTARRMVGPPWVRTRVVDPITLADVPAGEEGLLLHLDAAARSSAVALLTEDRGRMLADGFELRGRMPGAAPRGCSLALDELVRAAESGGDDPS
jgi:hypothetical protein